MHIKKTISRREACYLLGVSVIGMGWVFSCKPLGPKQNLNLDNVHYQKLHEVANLIKNGKLTSEKLTKHMLDRINSIDKNLFSYITVMSAYAIEKSKLADKEIAAGNYKGPLHGIPIAVKDLIYTKQAPTTGGYAFQKDFYPEFDATVVEKLERAGAVIIGKLNLTEGAMACYHDNFEIPINPWDKDSWPGASSSGSGVATAAGLCFGALGSDTGGSIRFPSMANGVIGLKPTYGRVSKFGVLPLSESLDHIGPLTRCTKDAAIILDAISGFDPNDVNSSDREYRPITESLEEEINGLRIGVDENYIREGVPEKISESILQAIMEFESLGVEIVKFNVPWDKDTLGGLWFSLVAHEAAKAHHAHYPSRANEYGPYFRDFLEFGASVSAEDYRKAKESQEGFEQQFKDLFNSFDVLIAPAGTLPIGITHDVQRGDMDGFSPFMPAVNMHFTIPADLAGTPAITIPCGNSESEFHHSFQLMGPEFSEPVLCRVAHAFEKVSNWDQMHPKI